MGQIANSLPEQVGPAPCVVSPGSSFARGAVPTLRPRTSLPTVTLNRAFGNGRATCWTACTIDRHKPPVRPGQAADGFAAPCRGRSEWHGPGLEQPKTSEMKSTRPHQQASPCRRDAQLRSLQSGRYPGPTRGTSPAVLPLAVPVVSQRFNHGDGSAPGPSTRAAGRRSATCPP
jgi:hypothetical protein